MNTVDFKTRTILQSASNVTANSSWVIAMDIGYSAVKGLSGNSAFCFPSFARKVSSDTSMVGTPSPDDIQYKDESGLWDIGAIALSSISQYDKQDSEEVLYSRNRYYNPMFLVIARVGLALGLQDAMNEKSFAGKNIILQTGLPPAFLKSDTSILKKTLSGRHKFSVKVGTSAWVDYDFELKSEHIYVMAQPLGSLFGVTLNDNAAFIENASEYLNNGVLVFDGGFGTLDTFEIRNKRVNSSQTFDDLGMRAVFREVTDKLYSDHGIDIGVHALQLPLQTGYVKKFIPDEMRTEKVPIEKILEEANKEVCSKAISKIRSVYNNLLDFKFLLVTGGTGEAWFEILKEYFAGLEDLSVVSSSMNTTLPTIFSNVRGYYLYRVSNLLRR